MLGTQKYTCSLLKIKYGMKWFVLGNLEIKFKGNMRQRPNRKNYKMLRNVNFLKIIFYFEIIFLSNAQLNMALRSMWNACSIVPTISPEKRENICTNKISVFPSCIPERKRTFYWRGIFCICILPVKVLHHTKCMMYKSYTLMFDVVSLFCASLETEPFYNVMHKPTQNRVWLLSPQIFLFYPFLKLEKRQNTKLPTKPYLAVVFEPVGFYQTWEQSFSPKNEIRGKVPPISKYLDTNTCISFHIVIQTHLCSCMQSLWRPWL